jgi:hypothetical protein
MAADELVPPPTPEDLDRVQRFLSAVADRNVQWSPHERLEVLLVEHRIRADRQSARRLLVATYVLAGATGALVLATIGLIVVTATR